MPQFILLVLAADFHNTTKMKFVWLVCFGLDRAICKRIAKTVTWGLPLKGMLSFLPLKLPVAYAFTR